MTERTKLERRERWATFAGIALIAFGAVSGVLPATGVGIGLVLVGRHVRRTTEEPAPRAKPIAPDGSNVVEPMPFFFRVALAGGLLAVLVLLLTWLPGGEKTSKQRWTFVDTATPAELGLSPRVESAGGWTLEEHAFATGGRAMVNHEGDPASSPGILLASGTRVRAVRAMTRCKGEGCGLAFRVIDERSYSVARVLGSAGRVELVSVRDGVEHVLDRARIAGAADGWQELAVEARGDVVRVSSNGRVVLETTHAAPAPFGSVGLWAPAASRAYFDELVVEPLAASPQALEVLPLLRRPST